MKLSAVTVFADGGSTPFDGVYAYAGDVLGKRGAHLICPLREGLWPTALVDAALRHKRAQVTFVAMEENAPADVPQPVKVEIARDQRAADLKAASLGQVVIGLPARFGTVSALYTAWTDLGGARSGKPVGLLNRKRAYDVVRGFIGDVASVGLAGRTDHLIQFSESFDDLCNRLERLV